MAHSSSNMDILFAFVLGGLVGAGVTMLLTPYSGKETRRKIREEVEDVEDWAKDRCDEIKENVERRLERIKQVVQERKDDLKRAYQAGKEAFVKEKERLVKEQPAS